MAYGLPLIATTAVVGRPGKIALVLSAVDQITERVSDHAGNQYVGEGFLYNVLS